MNKSPINKSSSTVLTNMKNTLNLSNNLERYEDEIYGIFEFLENIEGFETTREILQDDLKNKKPLNPHLFGKIKKFSELYDGDINIKNASGGFLGLGEFNVKQEFKEDENFIDHLRSFIVDYLFYLDDERDFLRSQLIQYLYTYVNTYK